MAISKDIVQKYIDSALKSEVLEDSFMPYVLTDKADTESKTQNANCPGVKRILLTISTNSEPDTIIKHYVDLMYQVKSPTKFDVLFDLLRLLAQQHPHLGKGVCEALLCCERIDYHNRNSWMRSFQLTSEILPNVDYKGARDILKYVLEVIYTLPERFDISIIPQLDTLYATFSMILDREACLLPAYLSLDELQKSITTGSAPVWKFAELFYHFIESFRPTAQIFSIVNRSELLPVVGSSTCHGNPSWRLDALSAKFQLKGLLPYTDKLKEPQGALVRYVLEQPYSKEMILNTVALSLKPSPQARCSELIEQIAVSLIHAMENSELNIESYNQLDTNSSEHLFQWLHISNNVLYYIVYNQVISFEHLIESLCQKIKAKKLKKGREHLMWAMLQYITSTKSSVTDFYAVFKLFDVLYTSRTPLQLPTQDSYMSAHILAAASVWIQLVRKAEAEQTRLYRPLPPSLQLHYEYLNNVRQTEEVTYSISYKDAIILNAYGTSKSPNTLTNFGDYLSRFDPINNPTPSNAQPLPMSLLDSLTAHSRHSLLHSIVHRIINLCDNKRAPQNNFELTPGLIETYGRLLAYTDTEMNGLKLFVNQVLNGPNSVWRSQAWHIYNVLMEMYNYRLHHVPVHYKIQVLSQLHNMTPVAYGVNSQMQLSITTEATELKLILGLSNYEALNMPTNCRHPNDTKTPKLVIHGDSEELNKVMVLVLARSTHITVSEAVSATFLEDMLSDINNVTPLRWSSSSLHFFPTIIKEFFIRNSSNQKTDPKQLQHAVEEEYRQWKGMMNENALLNYFSQPNAPPLFICVLWKMLLDNEYLNPVVYKILENIRAKTLSAHLRTFVEYLVFEFANLLGGQHVNRYSEALNDLISKYQIISLDRLLLCMCLIGFDGSAEQVCLFIIQLLLLKVSDFRNVVKKFSDMQSPKHWEQNAQCYKVNSDFQRLHPEKYYHDFLADHNIPSVGQTLPSYFSNCCLRFIPVFDILIHRALELRITATNAAIKIDTLLDEFGCLYKFHDKPLTYLYHTLHYYDSQLTSSLKRKLTATIIGAFNEIRPNYWCLSEEFTQYLVKSSSSSSQVADSWIPDQSYYRKLIGRLVETLQGNNSFYHTDWRFNEFLNVKSHAVHSTAIELMALPLSSEIIGNAILDLVLTSYVNQDRSTMPHWMNAIGLVMTSLPLSFYNVLNSKILEYMKSPLLTNSSYTRDILHLINFCDNHERMYESQISYLVALTHAIWHHSSPGQIFCLNNFWRIDIKEAVETESQFLFVCCILGPFLPRLERTKVMMDVVVELYEMLGKVDGSSDIQHLDTICDFFYHIKYMFTGDAVKNEIERCIRNFKPKLRNCLRFITHLNVANEQLHKTD